MINPLHIINTIRSPYLYLGVAEDAEVFSDTINIGNRAVTARCRHRGNGEYFLLKCYYRTINHGAEIYGERFHANALRVYTIGGITEFADVLIDRWVEGEPLDVRVEARDCDFRSLSRAFDRMALELLGQTWAHGDVKPENIICRPDGNMQLVDMDAMWMEGMPLERCHEYGTPEFSHPRRVQMTVGKHIDDFAVALISTALAAAALDPEMFRSALDARRRIFIPSCIVEGRDAGLNHALMLLRSAGDVAHYQIGASLRTDDGVIPNLEALMREALNPQCVSCKLTTELSLAAEDISTYTTR